MTNGEPRDPPSPKQKCLYIRVEPELHAELMALIKRRKSGAAVKQSFNTWARAALVTQLRKDQAS